VVVVKGAEGGGIERRRAAAAEEAERRPRATRNMMDGAEGKTPARRDCRVVNFAHVATVIDI
jgi:hypothetical protein